jgi:hypothetical protein
MPDSKLLEIVKDGNIQVALFLACGFLLITKHFVALSLPLWSNALVWFGFFLFWLSDGYSDRRFISLA